MMLESSDLLIFRCSRHTCLYINDKRLWKRYYVHIAEKSYSMNNNDMLSDLMTDLDVVFVMSGNYSTNVMQIYASTYIRTQDIDFCKYLWENWYQSLINRNSRCRTISITLMYWKSLGLKKWLYCNMYMYVFCVKNVVNTKNNGIGRHRNQLKTNNLWKL